MNNGLPGARQFQSLGVERHVGFWFSHGIKRICPLVQNDAAISAQDEINRFGELIGFN